MEKNIKEKILKGFPFLFPTETVLGLGVIWSKGIEKLYQLKKRERGKPLSLHLSKEIEWKTFIKIEYSWQEKMIKKFAPGPYTFIFPKNSDKLKDEIFPFPTVGLRFPANSIFQNIILELKQPVWGTSANLSGQKAALSYSQIPQELKEKAISLIPENFSLPSSNLASTVIDLTKFPYWKKMVLRKGGGKIDKIKDFFLVEKINIVLK